MNQLFPALYIGNIALKRLQLWEVLLGLLKRALPSASDDHGAAGVQEMLS